MNAKRLLPWAYVLLLCAAVGAGVWSAVPAPNDDFGLYQSFAEALAAGKLDLTIPGFHGSDIFAVPLVWITGSGLAQIYAMNVLATLLPLFAFLAGRALWKEEHCGIFLATIMALTPFVTTVGLRGWTGPGYWTLMLLTIWFAAMRSSWTGLTWALAILTKPFAIVLGPLILALSREKGSARRLPHFILWSAAAIVFAYLLLQYLDAGRIFVGAHAETSPGQVLQSLERIGLNLAHSLQILFSVHNYYYPDPSLTGPGNMMHTSPVLVFLGLFGLLAARTYERNQRIARSLLIGSVAGILMNALLDHMDHFYMEASVLLLILASLPVLMKHRLWIPLALATLHFQPFYFYMQYQSGFQLTWMFFLPAVVADIALILWLTDTLATRRRSAVRPPS